MTLAAAAAVSALLWLALLLLPWKPWRADVTFEPEIVIPDRARARSYQERASDSLENVTALIPARNEAALLPQCLGALKAQAAALRIVVVDDQSSDATAEIARAAGADVVSGTPLPQGWSGKVWALEQGLAHVESEYVLLLDADIALAEGTVASLLAKARREALAFVSIVPEPRLERFWEKLLMPAFVYFFALLYPFRLSNSTRSRVAAASGGCVLAERRALHAIGGFASLKEALIDDCTLAARVKGGGYRTWIGLSRAAKGLRSYERLRDVGSMVARTAYTQLRYSPGMLALCTALMLLAFVIPPLVLFSGHGPAAAFGLVALAAMALSYLPTLRYYGCSPAWAMALPAIGVLFLNMTWTSAWRYHRCETARWKDRVYAANAENRTFGTPIASRGRR